MGFSSVLKSGNKLGYHSGETTEFMHQAFRSAEFDQVKNFNCTVDLDQVNHIDQQKQAIGQYYRHGLDENSVQDKLRQPNVLNQRNFGSLFTISEIQ